MLETAADAITKAQFSLSTGAIDELAAVAFEMDDYLRDLVGEKRTNPDDDLLSRLAFTEVDGDRLETEEIVSITASVLNAGMDTTRHQACLTVTAFAEHGDQWALLRSDPTLASNAVEEAMRFRPVTPLLTRVNRKPVRVQDTDYPAGTFMSLAVVTANRDEALNPGDPHAFDIARDSPRHLAFGHGPHYCLGAALARLELTVLLSVMAERFSSIEIVGDVPRRPVMGVYGVKELVLARG
jgi:cytochrome P450